MSAPIYTQGIVLDLPSYALRSGNLPYCKRNRWNLAYAAFTGFYSYHLLRIKLVKRYAYIMKLDFDIGIT